MVLKRLLKLAENLLHPLTMHHFGLALFLFFHLLLVRTSRQSQVTCFFAFYWRKSQNCILLQYENSHVCLADSPNKPRLSTKTSKSCQPTKISSASFSSFIFSRILRFFHHRVTSWWVSNPTFRSNRNHHVSFECSKRNLKKGRH